MFGACSAFGQGTDTPSALPDAPSAQIANSRAVFRASLDTARQPANTPGGNQNLAFQCNDFQYDALQYDALKYDPLHLQAETSRTNAADLTAWNPSLLKPGPAFHGSNSSSLVGRATDAASSIVFTRDEDGNRKLNAQYLLRLLTATTAHVAEHRYGRRTIGQPLNDFGSTLGNDAGMNVLHEFQPGLLELLKSHEPKFVSRIAEHAHQK